MSRLILASASPRRAEILRDAGLDIEVRPTRIDERLSGAPNVAALALATEKALAVGGDTEEGWIVAADTIVAHGDNVVGKPADAGAAKALLKKLSGITHEVWTGVCVLRRPTGNLARRVVSARVTFRELGDDEVDAYVATGQALDKAGGYDLAGEAAGFVKEVEGDPTTVRGLPLATTLRLLKTTGFDVPEAAWKRAGEKP